MGKKRQGAKKLTLAEYRQAFSGRVYGPSRDELALQLALDIRKFEIDLYWKRAGYFWTIVTAALAGYLAVMGIDKYEYRAPALLLITSFGLTCSVAWYLVNRGSKHWQNNWENHVDLLEDSVVGPLYKTIVRDDNAAWWRFWTSHPYSVSKLNQLVSLFVLGLFAILYEQTLQRQYVVPRTWLAVDGFATSIVLLTTLAVLSLLWFGRTGRIDESKRVTAEGRVTEL